MSLRSESGSVRTVGLSGPFPGFFLVKTDDRRNRGLTIGDNRQPVAPYSTMLSPRASANHAAYMSPFGPFARDIQRSVCAPSVHSVSPLWTAAQATFVILYLAGLAIAFWIWLQVSIIVESDRSGNRIMFDLCIMTSLG